MEKKYDVITVQGIPIVSANFNWSVGFQMQKFLKTLAQKKLLASKCPQCRYVLFPPRNHCVRCHTKMEEKDLIELSGKGTVLSWTIAYVELDGKGNFLDLKKPKILSAIKLDETHSTIFMPLEEIDPKELKVGLRVEPLWNAETKGGWKDLKAFKPAKN